MADDDRGADVITLPTLNLLGPDDSALPDTGPTVATLPDAVPPPDFSLPFDLPEDEDDGSEHDPDNAASEMIANAASGTGTPNRATASMAMVTMAAVAVAALRGTWSMASYLKARREHHDAVADKAREGADKAKIHNAAQRAKDGVGPWGAGAKGAGPKGSGGAGRGGASSGSGGGRGAFGQKTSPGSGSGRKGSTGSGSSGLGSGPKSSKGGGRNSGSGSPSRGGSGGRKSGRNNASGSSGSDRKSAGHGGRNSSSGGGTGARKKPGTLGTLATGRQKRKADEAQHARKESGAQAAHQRKQEAADRAAERKEAAAAAAERRKRKADKRKRRAEQEKQREKDSLDPKTGKPKKDDKAEKVDLKKKPKTADGEKDDKAADGDEKKTTGEAKKPKPPKKKRAPRRGRSRKTRTGRGPKTRTRRKSRRRRKGRTDTDGQQMPGADGEWLKPPPGWDMSYTVTIERVDRPKASERQPAGITSGTKGLPAGKSGTVQPTRSERKGPIVVGSAMEVGEVGDTQFVDADLTVYDLIESDEEMGEEILLGVEHTRLVASKCEGLIGGLEGLYATCIEKKVPGVLVKWCVRLIERAQSVQTKAEALAESLPRASEAILSARDVAVEVDKGRADAVKDAGHVAPAEREYHDRSGV